jgi:hypothetical protein
MPVLSAEDRSFWEENGYIVVHDAVPPENIESARDAIWGFAEMDPQAPESWYADPPRQSIMVEFYQHQTLWNNRQFPRVHQTFSEIWGTEKLWVSFDRASINPPLRHDYHNPGLLHFDIKLKPPVGLGVQGVLYLTDTASNQGAFTCVPGFHKKVDEWFHALPPDADPNKQDLAAFGPIPIAGQAGDLVIWHSALPHGYGSNTADRPRVAQYITMSPAPASNVGEAARQSRIEGWRDRLTGLGKGEKAKENHTGKTAELTPLGRKLLGLDLW